MNRRKFLKACLQVGIAASVSRIVKLPDVPVREVITPFQDTFSSGELTLEKIQRAAELLNDAPIYPNYMVVSKSMADWLEYHPALSNVHQRDDVPDNYLIALDKDYIKDWDNEFSTCI